MNTRFTPFGTIIVGVLITLGVAGLYGIYIFLTNSSTSNSTPTLTTSTVKKVVNTPLPSVTIGFVGDIMVHTPMSQAVKNDAGTYEFDSMFTKVLPYTQTPNIMIGNLETPVTNDGTLSGYPNFDAPIELLSALKQAGFDMLQVANNHAADQGAVGIEKTLKNIESFDMIPIGGSQFRAMAYKPVLQTTNGITIAFIAATSWLNGYALPTEKEHLNNIIDIEKISTSAQDARMQGADIVIVLPHFGVEYEQSPNEDQKQLVEELISAGVDAIIGTHPHVVQPTEERTLADGRKVFIAYSLGNFISNQQDKYTDLELMINLTYTRDRVTGKVMLSNAEEIPLYNHKYADDAGKKHFEVVKLSEAHTLPYLTEEDLQRLDDYQNLYQPIENLAADTGSQ